MKTLDEIIKALEVCTSDRGGCGECPFNDNCKPDDKWDDALHYLKEYRDSKETIADAMERYTRAALWHMDEANKLASQSFVMEYDNPPLTWDELKTMEGKPVWVEHKYYSKWLIVYEVYEHTIVLDGNGFYVQYFSDDNDKEVRWKAYRKERNDTPRSN